MNAASTSRSKVASSIALIVVGVAFGAGGIYVGETDDAPGAALIGLVLMAAAIVMAVRRLRAGP